MDRKIKIHKENLFFELIEKIHCFTIDILNDYQIKENKKKLNNLYIEFKSEIHQNLYITIDKESYLRNIISRVNELYNETKDFGNEKEQPPIYEFYSEINWILIILKNDLGEFLKIVTSSSISNPELENNNEQSSELFWNGTELEFTELIKALHESNLISRLNDKGDIKQNFLFAVMRKLFNVSDYNENDKIKEIRKRKDKKTPLLYLLEKNLLEFINKKDELKKNS